MVRCCVLGLALLVGNGNAFSNQHFKPSAKIISASNNDIRTTSLLLPKTSSSALHMSDDKKSVSVTTKTGYQQKEIAYDEKSGRFFETDMECVPEDEYCVVDQETGNLVRLTLEEKERIFLDALQSYYVSGRQLLDDAEFDLLKEDLSWGGSDVVSMSKGELKFIAAKQAYLKGESIMSDAEFDTLKAELKEEGSKFAVNLEPKCYVDTGICTVTFQQDNFRNNLLYLPVGAILSLLWLGIGFELLSPIIALNPLILVILGAVPIFTGSKAITEGFIFPNNYVAYGPCPSCEAENRVYFGDILGVEGFKDVATSKCPNCKTMFQVQRNSLRASTLPKTD